MAGYILPEGKAMEIPVYQYIVERAKIDYCSLSREF
jgi:hypothetical protein